MADRPVHKLSAVSAAADRMHTYLQSTKRELINEINGGRRTPDKLRQLMEEYIEFQIALDVLHGYCELEHIKP